MLADEGRDLTRALTMLKKANDMEPDNPAYLDSLGWVYYKLGLDLEAKNFTRRAREKAPNNNTIGKHLAEIIKQQGPRQ